MSIEERLLEITQCPTCGEFLSKSSVCDKNEDHWLCGRCAALSSNCPFCGGKMTPCRNYILEDIIESLPKIVTATDDGMNCPLRCPHQARNYEEMKKHIRDRHPKAVRKFYKNCVVSLDVRSSSKSRSYLCQIVSFSRKFFVVKVKIEHDLRKADVQVGIIDACGRAFSYTLNGESEATKLFVPLRAWKKCEVRRVDLSGLNVLEVVIAKNP